MTCASPTCSRIFATCSSTMEPAATWFQAGTLVEEVLQRVLAELGVAHLGVPLQAVEATLAGLEGRNGGLGGGGGDGEALGRALDGVAVAHPHDLVIGVPPNRQESPETEASVCPYSRVPVRPTVPPGRGPSSGKP